MLLLELYRIGKPAERVAERADRELDQHLAIGGRIFVREDTFALLPDFEPEAHVIALRAVDPAGFEFGLKQDIAGIEIAQPHPPRVGRLRQHHAAAVIEIEPQSPVALLRGHRAGRRIGSLRRGRRLLGGSGGRTVGARSRLHGRGGEQRVAAARQATEWDWWKLARARRSRLARSRQPDLSE